MLAAGAGWCPGENGGNVVLAGGAGNGSGATGLVMLGTPTFSTNTNTNCATNCTISQSHIDNGSQVIVRATATGLTITMPDPTILTAGRLVYVTAANTSNDFTLLVNGGGTGNQIAMRQNTSATMIWNGSDWTARATPPVHGPVAYDEARGRVINDYQQSLEENWVKELRKEFQVTIDRAVFERVKAQLRS